MIEAVELAVQERVGRGTRKAKFLRKKGLVPAVLYGHKEATLSLALSGDALNKAVRRGARIVDLKQGETVQKALIRELQWDPLGHDILHVDFARVDKDEKIKLEVRIELRGTAPGVTAGGALVQPIHNLHVECSVLNVPNSIRVTIGELQLNQAIHVRDLQLPEGVTVTNDPDAIVVQVSPQVVAAEEAAPVAAVAESAEPEVIGRVKAEAEEEEEK